MMDTYQCVRWSTTWVARSTTWVGWSTTWDRRRTTWVGWIMDICFTGAASFLGGSMQTTVSLCVIMVEITNNLKLLPLIMLVLLISKAVGDAFNDGLYEEQALLRGIPLLESKPKYQMLKNDCNGGFWTKGGFHFDVSVFLQ